MLKVINNMNKYCDYSGPSTFSLVSESAVDPLSQSQTKKNSKAYIYIYVGCYIFKGHR